MNATLDIADLLYCRAAEEGHKTSRLAFLTTWSKRDPEPGKGFMTTLILIVINLLTLSSHVSYIKVHSSVFQSLSLAAVSTYLLPGHGIIPHLV